MSKGALSGLPETLGPYSKADSALLGWMPDVGNPTETERTVYARDGRTIEVHLARYVTDSGNSKLASFQTSTTADFDTRWRVQRRVERIVSDVTPALRLTEREVASNKTRLLVWQWSLVGTTETSNFLDAKWALLKSRLSGHGSDSMAVALATAIHDEDIDSARSQLLLLAPYVRDQLARAREMDANPGSSEKAR